VKEKKTSPFVDEIVAHMGSETYDTTPLKFDYVPGNRAWHGRKLEQYKKRVEALLIESPREGRETAEAWVKRFRSPRREDNGTLMMCGRLHAIIARMDDEAEVERRRKAADAKEKHKAMVADLRRREVVDTKEVAQLVSTIAAAAQGEALLASMLAALAAHRHAQEARVKLTALFDDAEFGARNQLRMHGEEPSSTRSMKRPTIADAPEGAVQFTEMLQRVIPHLATVTARSTPLVVNGSRAPKRRPMRASVASR
jgi:hypothetical protein